MLRRVAVVAAALTIFALPAAAQEIALSTDVLDRFVVSHDKEREEIAALDPKLAEIDQRIRRFRECKMAFEVAGSASRSRLGGLAARAGIRARCGANSEADIARERTTVREQATARAAQAGQFTVPQFSRLRTRLERIYAYGDRAGLAAPELEAVNARRERFASIFGGGTAIADAIASAGVGRPMAGQWTADLSWAYIGGLFAMVYGTGANVFDQPYQPGQWTRWEMRSDDDDDKQLLERAFISRSEEDGEWWRFKTIAGSDTIVLEALFKSAGDGVQELVRMRGKMPGDREANELMVPQQMTMVRSLGMFGSRPTKESVDGATVGTENVTTPAGTFSAKLVRFGGMGGRQEWWVSDRVPGGWVQYRVSPAEGEGSFRMVLVGHGTGAVSELGSR
jgi:hypothetical protein